MQNIKPKTCTCCAFPSFWGNRGLVKTAHGIPTESALGQGLFGNIV